MDNLIISFTKELLSFSAYSTLGYIFLSGLVLFLVHYLIQIRGYLKEWSKMDSFDKFVFIILLGILVLMPAFLLTIGLFLIIFLIYCLVAPYISGKSMDYFKPMFIILTIIYLLFLITITKKSKSQKGLIGKTAYISLAISFILFFVDIILAVAIIVFGIISKCIG